MATRKAHLMLSGIVLILTVMALALLMETHKGTFGPMLLVYKKTLFILMVNLNVLVLPVVHRQFLHLLVMTTSVSLVVQDILT